LIIFGKNVTDEVGHQKALHFPTSPNYCFCTIWWNAETQKYHPFTHIQ